jgi:beta-glucanase (GH16 family)
MLWPGTHRDVHPMPTSYDEMRDKTFACAAVIKQVDPAAQTLGPVLWGWNAYFYSALDTAEDQWWNKPPVDRNAHGGTPFVDWYLQQMRTYEQDTGTRILDYLDLHFYPQGNGVSGNDGGNSSLQALRLRSTRALWDPDYYDESWINDYVRLIPRMRQWVSNNYPGTKIAITEYNWGALGTMNGGLAQADVLGIFGREQLDLATLWGPQESNKPWAYAFRMYRNYDGAGNAFGDVSVQASSADQEKLSIYAALRSSDAALTLMLINKSSVDLDTTVQLSGFSPSGAAKVYRYSEANLRAIVPQPDQTADQSGFRARFPAYSITLMVLPAAAGTTDEAALTFAHVVAGGGFSTIFTVSNTGNSTAMGTLILTDQAGNPLNVTLNSASGLLQSGATSASAEGSSYPISLAAGGTIVATAARAGASDARSGWARVESPSGSLGGVATFQTAEGGILKSVAGVLASQLVEAATIPIDNDDSKNRFTGFAVANPGISDVHLTLTSLAEDGKVVEILRPAELNPLSPQKQVARFLHEYSAAGSKFRGSITLVANPGEQFIVVALNLIQGLYTAVPVIQKGSEWKLVWSDEFSGRDNTSPDSTKWVFETGGGGWGNNELETYTARLENAYLEHGMLVIKASKETFTGTDGRTRDYTSARMKTQGKMEQKYGRIEARMKLPAGQGLWPAFWMLGNDFAQTGWPGCGEIDIMEHIGKEPTRAYGTIHGPGYSGGSGIGASYTLPSGQRFADDYHVFAIEWEPEAIRWYVDGNLYQTRTPADLPTGKKWVFDHPFFIILNLAVGGSWPGNPDATTVFPQMIYVDYVRVYERNS